MSPRVRKTAAIVSSAVLVGGGGVAAVAAASGGSATKSKQQAGSGYGYGQGGPGGPGGRGPGGPGRGGPMSSDALATIAKTLGVTTDQLQAAIDAARPADGTKPDRDGKDGIASELASALGVDAAKIQTILEANRPTPPAGQPGTPPAQGSGGGQRPADGAKPGRPDDSKLIAALATGLSIDQATVKAAFEKIAAAHEADHTARETAMYDAIAKALGVDASAVKSAFEAARPERPSTGG